MSSKPLTITVSEYPPYHSKDLPGFGINAQIVTAAFESQDISIDYKQMNTWKEANRFDHAAQGKADAAAFGDWEFIMKEIFQFLSHDNDTHGYFLMAVLSKLRASHEEDFLISEPWYIKA